MSRLVDRLDAAASVALIIASIAVVALFAMSYWRSDGSAAHAVGEQYAVGEALPVFEGVHYADASKTVLVFLSTKCRFCSESMPFYERLATMKGSVDFQFVILGPEPADALRAFATRNGVSPDRVTTVKLGGLKVQGTPTLILASRNGHVLGQWPGLLKQREEVVIAALQR